MRRWFFLAGLVLLTTAAAPAVPAAEATVAVAANFTAAARELGAAFAAETGHEVTFSVGSTGKLYAQIVHGAPFDVFLAADAARPQRLEREDRTVPGSRFTYAVGRLVLWSRDPALVDAEGAVLRRAGFGRIALANPRTAPYGVAAVQALTALGVWPALQEKAVYGDSIAQTHQFVATGSVELGMVALAQVVLTDEGSAWTVPSKLYDPIEQQAVLLRRGADNPAATAFIEFLRSDAARAIIRRYGYDTG